MEQKQQNRLSMYRDSLAVLMQKQNLWSNLPPFARAVADLQQSITGRETAATVQAQPTTGFTQASDNSLTEATNAVMQLADDALAHALEVHDTALYSRLNLKRSFLLRLPANALLAALSQMADAITAIQPQLETEYGTTATQVQDMNTKIAAARQATTQPRNQISARSAATDTIPQLENDARNALQRIDRLINRYQATEPDWVNTYRAVRRIVDSGIRHRHPDQPRQP